MCVLATKGAVRFFHDNRRPELAQNSRNDVLSQAPEISSDRESRLCANSCQPPFTKPRDVVRYPDRGRLG